MQTPTARQMLSILVVAVLMLNLTAEATAARADKKANVIAIPAGSAVEVRLKTKQTLYGRMARVGESSFSIQMVQANNIEEREISFAELKSVKAVSSYARSADEAKSAKASVMRLPVGSLVAVRLESKEALQGRMGEINQNGFFMQTDRSGKGEKREIGFRELKSINRIGNSHTVRNVVIVVGVAAVVIGLLVLHSFGAALGDVYGR